MENCYCGSSKSYNHCCGLLHTGKSKATTARELMASRYSAFASGEIEYILNTEILATPNDPDELKNWCVSTEWEKLEIIQTTAGKESDHEGTVTFHAFYRENKVSYQLTETSKFKKVDDTWMYIGGDAKFIKLPAIQNQEVGRNDPCPCNSGKKYKKCCGS